MVIYTVALRFKTLVLALFKATIGHKSIKKQGHYEPRAMEVASSNPVQFFFQLILRSSSTSRACRSPPTSRRPRPGLRLPAASEAAKCLTPATLTAEAELSSNRFESCPFESGTRMKTGIKTGSKVTETFFKPKLT